MLLNCDLGELEGETTPTSDELAMPHIHLANIACGFHAGTPTTMNRTLALAARHQVAVGAHPAYPDRDNFGRTSMALSRQAIIDIVHYQVAALEGLARIQGLALHHVKPHGALYNDMMADATVREAVIAAVASYPTALPLVLQATPAQAQHSDEAAAAGVSLMFEAFADRRYNDDGLLVSRAEAGAVLAGDDMLAQAELLWRESAVHTAGGKRLQLQVDTLCVHGDNAEGIAAIAALRRLLDGS